MESAAEPSPVPASVESVPAGLRDVLERRIEAGNLELPMLPNVAAQLLDGSVAERADLAEISELLHTDQAITGHVLRIANSAAYGGSGRIQSIQQALLRIGLTQLREIVLAVAVQNGVFRIQGHEALVSQLWKHSAVAGAYAREIARSLRTNAESSFLCGLLHDVGKPVVLGLALGIDADLSDDLCTAVLGPYHASVGRSLAETWALPGAIVESITHHHDPAAATTHGPSVNIACLANLFAHLALDRPDDEDLLRGHPVCIALNLYPEDLDALVAKRDDMLEVADGLTV